MASRESSRQINPIASISLGVLPIGTVVGVGVNAAAVAAIAIATATATACQNIPDGP